MTTKSVTASTKGDLDNIWKYETMTSSYGCIIPGSYDRWNSILLRILERVLGRHLLLFSFSVDKKPIAPQDIPTMTFCYE